MFNFNNAGEAVDPEEIDEETEEEEESESEEESSSTTNDPLDAITDPEARAEAKRLRAIHRRQERKDKVKVEEKEPITPSNFATKDDLKLMATNAAKEKVAPEVKELWDELVAIPLGGFDPMSAESIASNMQKRFNLYKLEHPDETEDPTKKLTVSQDTGVKGGVKGKDSTHAPQINLPGYKEPVPPSEWYK